MVNLITPSQAPAYAGRRTMLELFAGVGAWHLGAVAAGLTPVAACEADPWRAAMFHELYGVPVHPDARALDAAWFRNATGLVRPWIILGSPPCQHISAANARGRGVDGDGLFFEAIRIVNALRPARFAFENSPRLTGRGLDRVADALEAAGYAVGAVCLGSGHAGAAHRRERIFVVGADAAHVTGRAPGQPWFAGILDTDADEEPRRVQRRPDGGVSGQGADDRRRAGRDGRGRLDPHADENRQSGRAVDAAMGGRLGELHPYADRDGLRIEQGRRLWADGAVAPVALDPRGGIGPVGSASLGRHISDYAGISAPTSERCRAALGDAISPIVCELVIQSILDLEVAA